MPSVHLFCFVDIYRDIIVIYVNLLLFTSACLWKFKIVAFQCFFVSSFSLPIDLIKGRTGITYQFNFWSVGICRILTMCYLYISEFIKVYNGLHVVHVVTKNWALHIKFHLDIRKWHVYQRIYFLNMGNCTLVVWDCIWWITSVSFSVFWWMFNFQVLYFVTVCPHDFTFCWLGYVKGSLLISWRLNLLNFFSLLFFILPDTRCSDIYPCELAEYFGFAWGSLISRRNLTLSH